jgi:hypothetical protein
VSRRCAGSRERCEPRTRPHAHRRGAALVIGGAESAGFFKEGAGFEEAPVEVHGKPIVVEVQGLTKFGDIERKH